MAELDISQTTTPTAVDDYSVDAQNTDGTSELNETYYDNGNFTKWNGLYNSTSKIKASIKAYATWVIGLGWTASTSDTAILEGITGSGEDSFQAILWNMLIIKKVNGDSYAEIIRNDKGTLINLKPLDPHSIRVVFNKQGTIERYEQKSKTKKTNRIIKVNRILHFVNDRTSDNTHGDSVIDAVQWNIEAQEEARRTHRNMIKRNGVVRVIEIDTDDTAKRNAFKAEWKDAIDKGDVLILPKGVAEAKDWHGSLDTQGVISWLNYLDDDFYQMIGLPKIIGGASGEIEGDSKVSYVAFEPVYKRAINELKSDLWNQLAIRLEVNLPPSIKNEVSDNEEKNASQTGFQPNDTTAGVGA